MTGTLVPNYMPYVSPSSPGWVLKAKTKKKRENKPKGKPMKSNPDRLPKVRCDLPLYLSLCIPSGNNAPQSRPIATCCTCSCRKLGLDRSDRPVAQHRVNSRSPLVLEAVRELEGLVVCRLPATLHIGAGCLGGSIGRDKTPNTTIGDGQLVFVIYTTQQI
jgi:hypothetical protein